MMHADFGVFVSDRRRHRSVPLNKNKNVAFVPGSRLSSIACIDRRYSVDYFSVTGLVYPSLFVEFRPALSAPELFSTRCCPSLFCCVWPVFCRRKRVEKQKLEDAIQRSDMRQKLKVVTPEIYKSLDLTVGTAEFAQVT